MKKVTLAIVFLASILSSCVAQNSTPELHVKEKAVVFFRPGESEYNDLLEGNSNYGELETDYSSGVYAFVEYLDSIEFRYVVVTEKVITFEYKNISMKFDINNGENRYGVIFFDNDSCPHISYGPYPTQFYIEKFNEIF
ncbi:MAG: hypothetical protein WBB45_07580 [Cyclobacteriaceae bacterium]